MNHINHTLIKLNKTLQNIDEIMETGLGRIVIMDCPLCPGKKGTFLLRNNDEEFTCMTVSFDENTLNNQCKKMGKLSDLISCRDGERLHIIDSPYADKRGWAPLEIDLVDLAYSHTSGDRDMAYEIGESIYKYLKNLNPNIDEWYKDKR